MSGNATKPAAEADRQQSGFETVLNGSAQRADSESADPGAGTPESGPETISGKTQAEAVFNAVKNLNAGLGETVGMLARDQKYKHLTLADLEWLVLPPLAANQVLTLRGKVKDKDGQENGLSVPLCLAFWAKVSEEVDQKLNAQKKAEAPLRLAPQDWTSGEIPWLALLTGPEELKPKLEVKLCSVLGERVKVFARQTAITEPDQGASATDKTGAVQGG